MYGEPNIYEYAEMVSEANKSISTNGFNCVHWNTGWVGYYIETPKGNKYQLVRNGILSKDGYSLCECSNNSTSTGKSLNLHFKDLDECKKYLILKESTKTVILTVAKEDTLENNNELHKKLDRKISDAKTSASKSDRVVSVEMER